MSEKRFTLKKCKLYDMRYNKDIPIATFRNVDDADVVCSWLNELYDENEDYKEAINMNERIFIPIVKNTKVGEVQGIFDSVEHKEYLNVHSICEMLNEEFCKVKQSENVKTNNRFILEDRGYDGFDIYDRFGEYKESDLFKGMTLQQIVDCLNVLNDENKQLQKENNILNKNEDDLEECTLENIKLKEENEQLRQQVQNAKEIAVKNDMQYQICRKEKEDFQDMCEQLRKELQKKQEEEQLYANEIVKLNKEVKDNQFLKLGNDY